MDTNLLWLLIGDLSYLVKGLNAIAESVSTQDTIQSVKNDTLDFCRLAEMTLTEIKKVMFTS